MKFIILFDGVCNLCNSVVQFIIKNDKANVFKFASLQSEYGKDFLAKRNLPVQELNTIILYELEKAYYTKSTAVLKIAKELNIPYNFLYGFIVLPSGARDILYSIIAKNRYRLFGKKESCMIPSSELTDKFIN